MSSRFLALNSNGEPVNAIFKAGVFEASETLEHSLVEIEPVAKPIVVYGLDQDQSVDLNVDVQAATAIVTLNTTVAAGAVTMFGHANHSRDAIVRSGTVTASPWPAQPWKYDPSAGRMAGGPMWVGVGQVLIIGSVGVNQAVFPLIEWEQIEL